jgi:GNAT superfamily N-acetyltransferase
LPEHEFRVQRVDPRRLHDLRRRVLRGGDPDATVADSRDDESTALHFAGILDDRVVVSASFYPSTSPVDESLVTYQLRYMATDFDVQGQGYGATVMAFAEQELRAEGAEQLWANGRDTALGFYRSERWEVVEGSGHLSSETRLAHHVIFKRLAGKS